MILEDMVVATAASLVVQMVKRANRAGEGHSDRKGHLASSWTVLLLLELLDQQTCFVRASHVRELCYA
jgi:hypothetical protein